MILLDTGKGEGMKACRRDINNFCQAIVIHIKNP